MALLLGVCMLGAPPALAHWVTPEDVVSRLRMEDWADRYGIVEVRRDAGLDRLLIVRVADRWRGLASSERRRAAEQWRSLWREASPQGILAIVDREDRTLVRFDRLGRAFLEIEKREAGEPQR